MQHWSYQRGTVIKRIYQVNKGPFGWIEYNEGNVKHQWSWQQ